MARPPKKEFGSNSRNTNTPKRNIRPGFKKSNTDEAETRNNFKKGPQKTEKSSFSDKRNQSSERKRDFSKKQENPNRSGGTSFKKYQRTDDPNKPGRTFKNKIVKSKDEVKEDIQKRGIRTERKFVNSDKSFKRSDSNKRDIINKDNKVEKPYKRPLRTTKTTFSESKVSKQEPVSKVEKKPVREGIRLNRYIANAGICSRREADNLIVEGLIKVNGKVVTEMGFMVKEGDAVKYGNRLLNPEKQVYLLLNKPKDFITTTNDPEERHTVMQLVSKACKERIYPVGRLDRNTTGLLLFTNDGELTEKLTHPSHKVKKIYQVEINRPLSPEDAQAILDGLYFEEGKAVVDSMAVLDPSRKVIGIEIHIGWNRIVRRIFEAKGYEVIKLDRVSYAGLTKKDLPRGHYRFLTEKEIIMLKHFV